MKNGKWIITVRLAAFVLAINTAVLFSPPLSTGEETEEMDFIPRVQQLNGAVEASMTHRDINNSSGGRSMDTTSDSAIEQLKLSLGGFVYHPRFVIYTLGGSFGLHRTSFATNGDSRWSSSSFEDYLFKTRILPEHPYYLDLFTSRQRSTTTSITSGQQSVSSARGATFFYNQNPLALSLSAFSNSVTGQDTTNSRSYLANGSYVLGPFKNSAGYTQTNSDTAAGTLASQTSSFFANDFIFFNNACNLNSSVNANQSRQTETSAQSWSDSVGWSEYLSAVLPLNFSAGLSHRYNSEQINAQTLSSPETSADSTFNGDAFSLSHQLYKSLRTSVSMNRDSSQSTGGRVDTAAQSLSLSYSKSIPFGGFTAGYGAGSTASSRTGVPTVTREIHSAAVPGSFTLNNLAVDRSSIAIMVKDPVNQNLVQLALNSNYQVLELGNTLEIAVLNLPAGVNPPPPPAVNFEFQVTYTLLPIGSTLDSKSNGVRFGFTLFDGLFNPYYSLSTTSQELVAGSLPGGNSSSTTETIGYTVQKTPFSLLAERSETRSTSNPSRTLRMVTDYREFISESIDISARLSYDYIVRPALTAAQGGGDNSEKATGLDLSIHKSFPRHNLNLLGGGSYTERTVLSSRAKSIMLTSTLNWRLGRLSVAASAATARTDSFGPFGESASHSVSYAVTVSRQLF